MRQEGLTLIECLIALVLVSIALLGVAGLQLSSLQDSRDSRWRAEALGLAETMIERIRANPDVAEAFEMAAVTAADAIDCSSSILSMCNDKKAWMKEVQRSLPNSRASIAVNVVNDVKRVRLALQWRQQSLEEGESLPACGANVLLGGCIELDTRL
ncbi:type IV pilus modification protein PilV [Pistricoccus aurantiacus]|uniref:type IV pilus modification protein PilV n=1 Tax=Pistricoccus aurantiacus TaxID=1883414 RepID=UPI003643E134